jgi:hypothetical protein
MQLQSCMPRAESRLTHGSRQSVEHSRARWGAGSPDASGPPTGEIPQRACVGLNQGRADEKGLLGQIRDPRPSWLFILFLLSFSFYFLHFQIQLNSSLNSNLMAHHLHCICIVNSSKFKDIYFLYIYYIISPFLIFQTLEFLLGFNFPLGY